MERIEPCLVPQLSGRSSATDVRSWTSVVVKQKLFKALQNLRNLIRQYSAGTGWDIAPTRPSGCPLNRNVVASGGLAPLPGRARALRCGISLPPPCLADKLPSAAQHRITPLVPFAALPVCCTIAIVTTCAECESPLSCDQAIEEPLLCNQASEEECPAAESSLLWEISILRTLADLRSAYEDLAIDPLWQFAMEGAKHHPKGQSVDCEDLDPNEAIYEFALMTRDEVMHGQQQCQQQEDAMETMDPLDALLEFAQLQLNSHCT